MKQLSSRELDDRLPLLAEGLALDEAFDCCTIHSVEGYRMGLVEMSCIVYLLLSEKYNLSHFASDASERHLVSEDF